MSRAWQVLAVIGLLAMAGCGPADEPEADAVQGGEGVTVEAGPAPAEGATELDVIPTNE